MSRKILVDHVVDGETVKSWPSCKAAAADLGVAPSTLSLWLDSAEDGLYPYQGGHLIQTVTTEDTTLLVRTADVVYMMTRPNGSITVETDEYCWNFGSKSVMEMSESHIHITGVLEED